MVRPLRFTPNPQTSADNAFQSRQQSAAQAIDAHTAAQRARDEVTTAAATLEAHGVHVHLFDDDGTQDTPDSVFPNNWFSTHAGGHVALYPMYSPNRRRERRADVIEMLKREYRVQDGTGAMVFDHAARVAYVARSNRADAVALERFCTHFNFEPMAFDAADAQGVAVYHTNVMMCVGTEFALIGLDMIGSIERREQVRARLQESGREVIELSFEQIDEFAGNALELRGRDGLLLAMSERAARCLTAGQRQCIEQSARIVALPVPTIELAGGSVRCMLAGIHLAAR
jgi:hypothetical protein